MQVYVVFSSDGYHEYFEAVASTLEGAREYAHEHFPENTNRHDDSGGETWGPGNSGDFNIIIIAVKVL
jgi:hypothetical protein